MKGYRELRNEVEKARKDMKEAEMMKFKKEKTVQTSFYKSPVGTRLGFLNFKYFSLLTNDKIEVNVKCI